MMYSVALTREHCLSTALHCSALVAALIDVLVVYEWISLSFPC